MSTDSDAAEGGSDVRERVLVEVTISAPVDTVWRALRDPAEVAQWFGWGGPDAGAEIEAIFGQGAAADEAMRTIAFIGTDDRFELSSAGDATIVRVVRALADGDDWSDVYEDMTEGWIGFAHQLAYMVEHARGRDRRVFHLSGDVTTAGGEGFLELLGRRLARHATGAGALGGPRVLRLSRHQVGAHVGEPLDMLVIGVERPPADGAPAGGSLTVSAYGADKAGFDAEQEAWRRWWSKHLSFGPATCG
ncbi:SRPBCC domain-containing protein [Mesorhizobium sp. ZMM04-5]|uniref:SRPBCC domain-containing protein n=1 Tax=Mesorhizobium marinum TaxID=3228790 RepID=A0ABV3R610_9HYPH